MDHHRLIRITLALSCSLYFSSCVTQTADVASATPKTFVRLNATPTKALTSAEQFLEWQKGYTIRIRDHERGLSVTEWTFDSPAERHRITLRATLDPIGAVLSAHTESQVLENQDWRELASSGEREAWLLAEIKTYIERR
jgi:hypothetical protein